MRWLEIENAGSHAAAVSRLAIMGGGLETMGGDIAARGMTGRSVDTYYRLGYFDADVWGKEGDFSWHALKPDIHEIAGRYRRDRHRHPMFILENTVKGTTFIAQLAYSGGYKFVLDYQAYREKDDTALGWTAEIDSSKPLIVLSAGETLTTPAVHIACVHGDHDDAVNAMFDHARKSVFTMPGTENACLIGAGMGPEHSMSVAMTKQYMEQMARAGVEVFIVDAGWYCPPDKQGEWWERVGDWQADPGRYPNGLAEVEAYCRKLGMKFGLWMEVERMGIKSRAHSEHPDWFTHRIDGSTSDSFLDFSNPDVVDWAEAQAAHVIEDYHLDLFRVDHNIVTSEYFHVGRRDGRRECRSMRQVEGFYELYRRLKKRFPNVVFENCASGGGRTDWGMVQNFNHTWVTDMQTAPRSIEITNGMTMALPPDRVDRLVAGMGSHKYASLDLHMRGAMLSHMTINVFAPDTAEMNPDVFDFIAHSTKIYKEFIRPFLPEARVYHPTPDCKAAREAGYTVLELVSAEADRAAIGVFTLTGWVGGEITFRPRGLNRGKTYRVTYDNDGGSEILTGAALMRGMTVFIPSALSSELITIEAIEA
jgi:alpha-galactosidase